MLFFCNASIIPLLLLTLINVFTIGAVTVGPFGSPDFGDPFDGECIFTPPTQSYVQSITATWDPSTSYICTITQFWSVYSECGGPDTYGVQGPSCTASLSVQLPINRGESDWFRNITLFFDYVDNQQQALVYIIMTTKCGYVFNAGATGTNPAYVMTTGNPLNGFFGTTNTSDGDTFPSLGGFFNSEYSTPACQQLQDVN